eukprot:2084414-Rhodomonas_salina.1
MLRTLNQKIESRGLIPEEDFAQVQLPEITNLADLSGTVIFKQRLVTLSNPSKGWRAVLAGRGQRRHHPGCFDRLYDDDVPLAPALACSPGLGRCAVGFKHQSDVLWNRWRWRSV